MFIDEYGNTEPGVCGFQQVESAMYNSLIDSFKQLTEHAENAVSSSMVTIYNKEEYDTNKNLAVTACKKFLEFYSDTN